MIELRPYQLALHQEIHGAWASGARNVCAVLPTGGGKTVNMAYETAICQGASVLIAHRQELVGQMSLALARNAIRHRIIGPSELARQITTLHMGECGRSFYDPSAPTGVAGVDTLVARYMPRTKKLDDGTFITKAPKITDGWCSQIVLWQTDEAHHLLRENKWGKCTDLFPNARGIGWTATPSRANGYGLGRHADGVMGALVVGPTMRELINAGYLTDYRIFAPPSDIDLSTVTVTASGDYSPPKLAAAVHKSHIVGDVVKHYLRIAPGKLGITFAVDIEHATEMAAAYRAAGVPAEVVTSNTPDTARVAILRRFKSRQILQLVNVDLFGEGFDLPAIEVVSMARPTNSFTLYAQQFGRALRLLEGKLHGIIIDHVNNWHRHGLPDRVRMWTLDRRERRGSYRPPDDNPLTSCPNCTATYERALPRCPYCEFKPEPVARSTPVQVDGDLLELDPDALRALRGEISRIDGPVYPPRGLDAAAVGALHKRHNERQKHQAWLRDRIALWSGWQRHQGRADSEIYKRFFFAFGTDVMTAQTLGAADAETLTGRIQSVLDSAGVVAETPRQELR